MSILVTGASGFVGQSLIKALKHANEYVMAAGRDLSVSEADETVSIPDYCAQDVWQTPLTGCDVVIHLAARVHVMKESFANTLAEFRKVNVEGTQQLAQTAANAGVKRFVYVSSVKVNGEQTGLSPFTELDIPNPQDPYGASDNHI